MNLQDEDEDGFLKHKRVILQFMELVLKTCLLSYSQILKYDNLSQISFISAASNLHDEIHLIDFKLKNWNQNKSLTYCSLRWRSIKFHFIKAFCESWCQQTKHSIIVQIIKFSIMNQYLFLWLNGLIGGMICQTESSRQAGVDCEAFRLGSVHHSVWTYSQNYKHTD